MAIVVEQWPPHMLRAVSTTFSPGAMNMSSQPLFLGAPAVFADPVDQRWFATLKSPPMEGKESTVNGKLRPSYREAEGRIARLKGMRGRLRIYDPLYVRPQYDAEIIASNWSDGRRFSDGRQWAAGLLPPSVTVDAVAYEEAVSIVVRGLPASKSRIFRIGDRFEARPNGLPADFGAYYMIVEDCASDAAGKTRIYFEPGLRVGVNVGDMIVLRKPMTVFSLIDDKQGIVQRTGRFGEFGVSLVEALPFDS